MRWTRAGVDVVGGRADAAGHAAEVAGGRGFTRAGGRGLYTLLSSALPWPPIHELAQSLMVHATKCCYVMHASYSFRYTYIVRLIGLDPS